VRRRTVETREKRVATHNSFSVVYQQLLTTGFYREIAMKETNGNIRKER
jgi:hypothetical protein